MNTIKNNYPSENDTYSVIQSLKEIIDIIKDNVDNEIIDDIYNTFRISYA